MPTPGNNTKGPNLTPEPPASEIDAELAAMLDREVRAGAPPQDDTPVSVSRHDQWGEPGLSPAPDKTREVAGPAGASSADSAAEHIPESEVANMQDSSSTDEGIDMPTPVETKASTGVSGKTKPAKPSSTPAQTPSSPSATPPQPPAPNPPPEQPAHPTRIGAIIIETGSAGASATGEGTPDVGPAGELIVSEPGASEPAPLALPGPRDVLPPGPGVRPASPTLPAPVQLAADQKTIIINRLNSVMDAGWQKSLHRQIDDLYKQVATEFSSPPESAERMLTLLQEARQILIEAPENYVAIESRIVQVRSIINRTSESRRQSARYGPRILLYELAWLLVFLLGIVFAAPLAAFFTRSGQVTGASASDVYPFWNTLMWGGIGGIIGALYALWWHISDQQDFDRHYSMWYMVQPIMGLVLGGIVFLLLSAGFLVLQVDVSATNTGARLVPYVVAVLAGFRQNFIYGQFDRLIALFAPGGKS